jgi:hypothetical protein
MASAGTCHKKATVDRLHGASTAGIEYRIEAPAIAVWLQDFPVLNPCLKWISHLNQCIEPAVAGFGIIPASTAPCVVSVGAESVYS